MGQCEEGGQGGMKSGRIARSILESLRKGASMGGAV